MSSYTFREIIFNYIGRYSYSIFILFIIVLFFGFGFWIYKTYSPSIFKSVPYDDVANAAATSKTATVTLYHATWCPACKKAKPQWDEFKQEYDGTKQVHGYTVVCKEVDCSNNEDSEVAAVIQKHNITGFPTIQMYVDNNTINFDSPITKSTLDLFVNKMLN
jgi:thiol-disulfide isomerase/thioredoxin